MMRPPPVSLSRLHFTPGAHEVVFVPGAELIRRVYEVDPLICARCGSEMRVIGFITQPALILDHIRRRDMVSGPARPPPHPSVPVASPA
jgi:hypothetical protein